MNMTGKTLFKFPNFPLSVCTQTGSIDPYVEKFIEAKIVVNDNSLINFLPWVDPKEIYLSQHNNSIGKTWEQHNIEFAKFINFFESGKIVDLGGGSGNIFKTYTQYCDPDVKWKIIDLNPTIDDKRVEIVRGLYSPDLINKGDTVVTSHFLEHQFDVYRFLTDLRFSNPKYHIFSLPNFSEYAKSNYAATIMFEHPNYLSERYLDHILPFTGWEILEKHYYKEHSIFYATRPSPHRSYLNEKTDSKDVDEVSRFLKYMTKRAQAVKDTNHMFYVYGAHFTYYYLLNMGISLDQIIAVVDGDPAKQGRRMYGTNHKVMSPSELPEDAEVFVEMGPYNKEIINNLPQNVILI